MKRKFLAPCLVALVATVAALIAAPEASAQVRTFAQRFTTNAKGDIAFVSNSLLTCSSAAGATNAAQCAGVQTGGTGVTPTNNNFSMINIDVDSDPATFNSSSATLAMPAGSNVLWAGLYWAANSSATNRNQMSFKVAGSSTYQTITASQVDSVNPSYQAFANVTALVAAANNGVYWGANVQANLGANNDAGWTIVVVYGNSTLPTRNLTVYDGYQRVSAGGLNQVDIALSGFITPPFGPVKTTIGTIAYDGDRTSTEGTAGLQFGPTPATLKPVFNAANPQADYFNSTISVNGVDVTTSPAPGRNPAYLNTLGYDADLSQPNTPLPNGATTAVVRVATSSETIDLGVVTLATDIFVPNIKDTLTKTVTDLDGGAVLPGDLLEYTVTFSNAGQDGALNTVLTDVMPTNVNYELGTLTVQLGTGAVTALTDSASDADVGNYDAANRRLTVYAGTGATNTKGGLYAPGAATTTVKFRARVKPQTVGGTVIDNFGQVDYDQQTLGGHASDLSDSDPAQAGDQPARVIVATPDVTISKALIGGLTQGATGQYTLTVANSSASPDLAAAPTFGTITVTEQPPSSLTVTGLSGSGWTCAVATLTCTRSDVLAVGASYPIITVTVSVASNAPTSVTNAAIVACACESPAASANKNSATLVSPVTKAAVWQVTKTAVGAFVRGSTASYSVVVTADSVGGPTNGSTVTVSDSLPSGTRLSAPPTGTGWTCSGVAGALSFSCTRNDILAAGASYPALTVPIAIDADAPATVSNTATVNGGGAPSPASGSVSTPVAASTDRSITKTVDNASPVVNLDIVTFTLTARNSGPSPATNVLVSDLLPAGLAFQSATPSQGTYNSGTGAWTVGTLANGGSATLRIRVKATAAGSIVNVASISGSEPDPIPGNDSARATLSGQQADLSLVKTASLATPNVGGNVTFTLTLTNAGPNTATGVTVFDQLPATLDFVSATPSAEYNSSTGLWTVGTVPVGNRVLTIVAKPNAPGAITNTAFVQNADQFDPNSTPGNNNAGENDQSSVTVVAQQADLAIAKRVDQANPRRGDTIVFTVTVANRGPSSATNVTVSDPIPAGLTFVSANASSGTYVSGTGLWTIPSINNGVTASLDITAIYNGPGQVTNTATLTGSDQPDPTPNGPASVSVPSQIADLSLTKTVSAATPNVGNNVVFTVRASNAGPNTATGVKVSDLLPAGLQFVSASADIGGYVAGTGEWTIGSIANGTSATLTITAKVVGLDPIINTAQISASDQYDPNSAPNNNVASENDQASASITPQSADLSLTKRVSNNPTPTIANPNTTFVVEVKNAGPSAATNLLLQDQLPPGLTLVSATPSGSTTYASGTGVWTVGTLNNGATATLTIVATVTDFNAPITNTALIASVDQPDPTPAPAANATVRGQSANLSVSKAVSNATPNVGSNVTYTVTVNNAGPDAATNVTLLDRLPAGLQFVSATASSGSYDPSTGVWNIGTVANAATATLSIIATITQTTAAPAISNDATIRTSDQYDSNTTNNSANVTLTPVPQADVMITKTPPPTLNPGASATYTLIVKNLGPSSAASVTVTDPPPAGLTQTAVSGGGCTSFPCNIGTLAAGEVRTINVDYAVPFPGPSGATLNNAATVSTTTADPNPGNNSSNVNTPIDRAADIRVAKTGSTSVVPGTFADFSITVTNDGPSTAAAVQLADPTPAGLTLIAAGTPCAAGFPCNLGDMSVGQSINVLVRYRAVASLLPGAPIANVASVSSSSDTTPGNNSATAQTTIAAPSADLQMVKVGPSSVLKGDTAGYTLTVFNNGPSDAQNVVLTDPAPVGTTVLSVSGDCAALPCTFVSIANGASKTVRIVISVPLNYALASPMVNRADVNADTNDPDGSNNIAEVRTNVITPPPQLDTRKSAVGSFVRGATASYTITVAALATAGPTNGSAVTVDDLLPAGITLAAAPSGSGWSCAGNAGAGSFSCTRSDVIVAGASYPTINVPVRISLTAPVTVTNTAVASGGGATSPASGSAVTPVSASADLSISKAVDKNRPVNASDPVTFTLRVTNAGPSDATTVIVTDRLPAGLVFVSAQPSQGSYNAVSGLWSVGNVAVGASATLALRTTVSNPSATITNTATVGANEPDPDATNNTARASTLAQSANLSLAKTVDAASPNVRSNVSFTLVVANAGPDAATNVVVNDRLPASLRFVSATPAADYNATTGDWTIANVGAGASRTLQIVAQVLSPAPIINRAEVTRSDQFDPNSTPGNGAADEDDFAAVTLTPQQADLQIAKSVDNPNPRRGEQVTFTVVVTNKGPSTATGVRVTDLLPTGLQLSAAQPSQGSYDSLTGLWTIGSLVNNGSASLTLAAIFNGPFTVTNTATISSSDQFDPTPTESASASVPSQIADLRLSKAANTTTPILGGNVSFTLTLSNQGPDRASSVSVRDVLPVGLTFVSASASNGSYDASTGLWSVAQINASATETLTLIARVDTPNPITNSAEVAASDQYDPDSVPGNNDATENDQASVTLTPQSSDLRISKRVSANAPSLASPNVIYTVDVVNTGNAATTGVVISDSLPAGTTFVSAVASQGSYANVSGLWAVGALAVNARATLSITAAVTDFTRPISNSARITASDQPDPTANPPVTATVQGQISDLSMTKTVSAGAPKVGDTISYTLTLSNAGPDSATHVRVLDRLPAGLRFVSANATQGLYDSGTGQWDVGTLLVGNATLTVSASVTQLTATAITNTAEVIASDQFDPNSTPNNGVPAENDQASATVTPVPVADLSVSKIAPAKIIPGENASYTITVRNSGPSIALAVQLADLGVPGLTLVSVAGGGCTALPCAIGAMAAGEERIVRVTYRVPFPYTLADPIANTASVSSSTFDPNLANNGVTVGTALDGRADVQIEKTGPTSVTAGQTATFTLVVSNLGPATAGGVVVNDPTPPGMSFISITGGGCTRFPCAIGTLANGARATITATFRINSDAKNGATLTNTASVTALTPDPDLTNNASTTQIAVTNTVADLRLRKTAGLPVKPGSTSRFIITVENLGPSDAQNVVIDDPAPAGGRITAVTGVCDSVPCSVPTLAVGASVTLNVDLLIDATNTGASLVNTAVVTSATFDPAQGDNTASATLTLLPVPDLTVRFGPVVPNLTQGGTISLIISNIGGASTDGPYTVTLPFPAGTTVLPTVGPGATFTLANGILTITFTTALPAGGSITIPFTYQSTTPGALIFTAVVAGGGEINTTNNLASTATVIPVAIEVSTGGTAWMLLLSLFLVAHARRRIRRL